MSNGSSPWPPATEYPSATRRSMYSRRLSSTSNWRCSMPMGELIASSLSVPLSGRLSRPALSPVCPSGHPVTSATPTLPPTSTRTSSRGHRGDKHRAPDSTGSIARLLGSAAAGFHDLAQLPRDRPCQVHGLARSCRRSARVDDMRHSAKGIEGAVHLLGEGED